MTFLRYTGLEPIYRLVLLKWWKRALRELSSRDPLHKDIPEIVHRIRTLESAR